MVCGYCGGGGGDPCGDCCGDYCGLLKVVRLPPECFFITYLLVGSGDVVLCVCVCVRVRKLRCGGCGRRGVGVTCTR